MKFWDTIAKMCGVTTRGRLSSPDSWDGDVMFGARALRVRWYHAASDMALTVEGHGLRLRDSTAFKNAGEPGSLRIGLIAIERIWPMKGKSGSTDVGAMASEAREQMQRDIDELNAQDVANWASKTKSADLLQAAKAMRRAAEVYAASIDLENRPPSPDLLASQ